LIGPSGEAIRVNARTIEEARAIAFLGTAAGPIDILEAVAIGKDDRVVFQKRERLQVAKGRDVHRGVIVSSNGSVTKAKLPRNPRNPENFDEEVEKLSKKTSAIDRKYLLPAVASYVAMLNRQKWDEMTKAQINSAFKKADAVFTKSVATQATKAMPPWAKATGDSGVVVGKGAFYSVHKEYFDHISISWDQPNTVAIKQIGVQGGWWYRNSAGVRSTALTAEARKIVERGMQQGFGRDQIAKDLRAQLGRSWRAAGFNYARVNAAVALGRSRSYSELKSYLSAGIEWLEIKAVQDERTTDICKALDGQVVSASAVDSVNEAAANVRRPEDIKVVNPFLREMRNPQTGLKEIRTRTGVKFATILSPGAGLRDQKGVYAFSKMGTQMAAEGVGTPPYHELCRSWTEPRGDIFQVPRGMQLRSPLQRTIPPPKVPREVKRPHEPLRVVKSPTPGNPTVMGVPSDLDRLDPTGRLLEMDPGRPFALRPGKHASFATFRPNAAGNAFVTGSRWQSLELDPRLARMPRYADWDQTDALRNFKADARDRVVNLWSRAMNQIEDVKAIILSESTGARRVSRVWQVFDARTGKKTFYRFDQAKRPTRKFLIELSNADGQKAAKLIRKLQDTGYITRASNPDKVFGKLAKEVDEIGRPL